jgi:hypothetical protein
MLLIGIARTKIIPITLPVIPTGFKSVKMMEVITE